MHEAEAHWTRQREHAIGFQGCNADNDCSCARPQGGGPGTLAWAQRCERGSQQEKGDRLV